MTENNDDHMGPVPANAVKPSIDEACDKAFNNLLSPEVIESLKETINKLETYDPQASKKDAISDGVVAMQLRKLLQDCDK
tara:strand:- start:234 stop:473 length:240 start_codon:yes stop_codon:yes gene_type:complete